MEIEMSTLYTNERAYCFLSEAEQAELEAAKKEGRVVYLDGFGEEWREKNTGRFCKTTVYRITKPELTKPSIDWDHVEDWVTCMATDVNGVTNQWEYVPAAGDWVWYNGGISASAMGFKSFRPGTCDWKDSLVMRPGVGK
jgi:hypothetical protein